MRPLHSLVYVSSANGDVTDDCLRHLLERAQARNALHAVTGLLLYDSGNFMQYIEGPADGLSIVYGHIQRDPLHTGIIELCWEEPTERAFIGWSMRARVLNAPWVGTPWQNHQDIDDRMATLATEENAGAALLRGFWQRGQHRRWQV